MKLNHERTEKFWNLFSAKKAQFLARLRQGVALAMTAAFLIVPTISTMLAAPAAVEAAPAPQPSPSAGGCRLNSARGEIQHVIYIQFDNVHFTRDNPNVPSDLEQIPNLLNFLTGNGTFSTRHFTPLKSHTADDIITSLTGVYGDRHGQPIANSFDWFTPAGIPNFTSSFQYWTDIISAANDPNFYMITPDGKNAPAPWVPWTRAGCNVGAVSIANMELENVGGDLQSVFGSDPTALAAAQAEVKSNRNQAIADFEGISIHCAASDAVCSTGNGGEPDLLPNEPGGYTGFNALYGHKFVAPVISPGAPLQDLDGNAVTDPKGNVGFPGFGGISAAQTLAYVAAMQEHGVPITYAYISDAHDNHTGGLFHEPAACLTDPETGGLGPGDACYEAQLAAYNEAFGKFLARLAADGINQNNTLFVVTADENDHFAGGPPSPSTCDGINVTCSYSKLGEIDSNMQDIMLKQDANTANTKFDIQFDMVPVFYLDGDPAVGSPVAREFERDAAALTAVSPITGNTDQLTVALSDPVDMKLLHMVTGDPQRTPTFVMWGNADWFWQLSGPDASENPGFAWNHGGIQPEIVNTWFGIAGPGVRNQGISDDVWSDHTDIRPTMLALAGLQDDYSSEGRVLAEDLHGWALPDGIADSGDAFVELARAYKAINAPNAQLGRDSLVISTRALASGSAADDSKYAELENQLTTITSFRDALAGQMFQLLEGAEFHNKRIHDWEARQLEFEADGLLGYVHFLASGHGDHGDH